MKQRNNNKQQLTKQQNSSTNKEFQMLYCVDLSYFRKITLNLLI